MRECLWNWLSNQGYAVAGEVTLENNKRIDLVGRKDGEIVGFEVKTVLGIESPAGISPTGATEAINQARKYGSSKYLDKAYLCCEAPEEVLECSKISQNNSVDIGLIKTSLSNSIETKFVKYSRHFGRQDTINMPRDNEAWVNHFSWNWANRNSKVATREGMLPNIEPLQKVRRVDISMFVGETNTNQILHNQDEFSHIGIESKGTTGLREDDYKEQLEEYLESGGLTNLYLSVPRKNKNTVVASLEQQTLDAGLDSQSLSQVGILTVDTGGNVEVIRESEDVEMCYDGIHYHDKYVPVGWGDREDDKSKDDFNNIYEMRSITDG